MTETNRRTILRLGWLLVLVGAAFNEWFVAGFFSPDGVISSVGVLVQRYWTPENGMVSVELDRFRQLKNRWTSTPVRAREKALTSCALRDIRAPNAGGTSD